jgi:hypothetical protein
MDHFPKKLKRLHFLLPAPKFFELLKCSFFMTLEKVMVDCLVFGIKPKKGEI